jgi:hypothetical protein
VLCLQRTNVKEWPSMAKTWTDSILLVKFLLYFLEFNLNCTHLYWVSVLLCWGVEATPTCYSLQADAYLYFLSLKLTRIWGRLCPVAKTNFEPNKLAQEVTFGTCNREVVGSSLNKETDRSDWGIPLSLHAKRLESASSQDTCVPIPYPVIVLSLGLVYCEVLAAPPSGKQ